MVKACAAEGGHWSRFADGDQLNLIQCAEQLEDPQGVLWGTYGNCTWQNGSMDAAKAVARGDRGQITRLGMSWGLAGYPTEVRQDGEIPTKSALHYIEDHDQERFVCSFGIKFAGEVLLQEGDRANWFKVQPYLIGLLTSKGIPMLWQGQEFGENYWPPPGGIGRVMLLRPVRWDYFYDETGKATVRLVRRLLSIRREHEESAAASDFFTTSGTATNARCCCSAHGRPLQSGGAELYRRRAGRAVPVPGGRRLLRAAGR